MSNGYVYSVKSGSRLPPGISLKRNGLLSGKATKAGEWRFAICAKDLVARRKGAANYVYSSCSGSTNFTVAPPPNPYPFDGNYEGSISVTATSYCPGGSATATTSAAAKFTVVRGIVNEAGTIAVSGSTGTATFSGAYSGISVNVTLNFVLGPDGSASLTGAETGSGTVGQCAATASGTMMATRVSP
jgi:hypothetical protein